MCFAEWICRPLKGQTNCRYRRRPHPSYRRRRRAFIESGVVDADDVTRFKDAPVSWGDIPRPLGPIGKSPGPRGVLSRFVAEPRQVASAARVEGIGRPVNVGLSHVAAVHGNARSRHSTGHGSRPRRSASPGVDVAVLQATVVVPVARQSSSLNAAYEVLAR